MSPEAVIFSIKLIFAFLILLGVVLFLVRPVVRMWRDRPDIDLLMPDYSGLAEEQEELEIPTDEDAGKPDRTSMIRKAQEDPRTTATLVQQWLKQKK